MKKILLATVLSGVVGLGFAATANMSVAGSVSAASSITVNVPLNIASMIITSSTTNPITYTLAPQTAIATLSGAGAASAQLSGTPAAGDFDVFVTQGAVTQVGIPATITLSGNAGSTPISFTPTYRGISSNMVDAGGQSCISAVLNGGTNCQFKTNDAAPGSFVIGGTYTIANPSIFVSGGAYTGSLTITTTDL